MKPHAVVLIAISMVLFLSLYAAGVVEFSVVVLSPLMGATLYIVIDVLTEVLRGRDPTR